MNIIQTQLEGVFIIEPTVFEDNRGFFMETYSKNALSQYINIEFVQDNHSLSVEKGTLRGLHFQNNPYAQSKLVRCINGKILDVAVDLRKNSKTYKKWISVELSAQNKKQLFIPKGFAHGFVTLCDNSEVIYKVDEYYNKDFDRSIFYNDLEIGINWGVKKPILSEKDKNAPLLCQSDVNF